MSFAENPTVSKNLPSSVLQVCYLRIHYYIQGAENWSLTHILQYSALCLTLHILLCIYNVQFVLCMYEVEFFFYVCT